jgi:hypothetical protein
MRRLGLETLAFADNNPGLWGTSIEGIRVNSSPDAASFSATQQPASACVLRDSSSGNIQKSFCFLPYYPLDLPHKALPFCEEVKAAFRLFQSEASRREYAQVAFRLLLDYNGLGWPDDVDHYFPPDLFNLGEKEGLVDCGAYDGDTLAAFVRRQGESFDSIIAFEPDSLHWEKLQRRSQGFPEPIRRKISSSRKRLGVAHETVYFDPTGTDLSAVGKVRWQWRA